eukprot:GGOE01020788.1.p1 GENE.GGOE01020788.1~~GGOE01020788.1.p1  ORF type:complete len:2385 (+),score=619.83 GGOE01020788.1:748-7155(+)
MEETGYIATASKAAFSALLDHFPRLSPAQVAQGVGLLAMSQDGGGVSNDRDLHVCFMTVAHSTMPNIPHIQPPASEPCSWNTDVFYQVINEKCQIDWKEVIRHLDYPGFQITQQRGLALILTLYKRATGEPMPVDPLFGLWKNRAGQLSILQHLSVVPPDLINWNSNADVLRYVKIDGLPRGVHHTTWASLDLIETLLDLADEEHYQQCRQVFEHPIRMCMDLFMVGVMQARPRHTALQNELIQQLLPLYALGRLTGPFSSLVIPHLVQTCPQTLAQGLTTIVHEDLAVLPKVIDLAVEHKFLNQLLDLSPDASLAVSIATQTAQNGHLNLLEWLSGVLGGDKPPGAKAMLARAFIRYAEEKVHNEEEKNNQAGAGGGGGGGKSAFPAEVVEEIFKALLQSPQGLPNAVQEQARTMYKEARQVCPKLHPIATEVDVFSVNIEEEANNYFGKIYSGQMSVAELIDMLERFKSSSDQREVDIYSCMIHNLFDEYRFFPKYPEKELQVTACLFGGIIARNVLSNIRLGIALRYVLQAIARAPNNRTQQFGILALDQFKHRLPEWPQYCSHLKRIPHLAQALPGIEQFLVSSGDNVSSPTTVASPTTPELPGSPLQAAKAAPAPMPTPPPPPPPPPQQPAPTLQPPPKPMAPTLPGAGGVPTGLPQAAVPAVPATPPPPAAKQTGFETTFDLGTLLGQINPSVDVPQDVKDKLGFLMNNLMETNLDQTVNEVRKFLHPQYLVYLAEYLVVKRASMEPNNHKLYLTFVEQLGMQDLDNYILQMTYNSVKLLLQSDKVRTSTSERSILKNLGSWLGLQTIARNKPLLNKYLNLRDLLFEALEQGTLLVVMPFVSKVLEHCVDSRIFRPPNPWVTGLLILLVEMHELPDLRLTLKFEVEVLLKNINVDMAEIHDIVAKNPDKSTLGRLEQIWNSLDREVSPDFQGKMESLPGMSSKPTSQLMAQQELMQMQHTFGQFQLQPNLASTSASNAFLGASQQQPAVANTGQPKPAAASSWTGVAAAATPAPASDAAPPKELRIAHQNLPQLVTINDSLPVLKGKPDVKVWVSFAISRAVAEIFQPVVERSVMTACTTTRELIMKDFAMDPDDNKMRQYARMMVQSLAANLAMVTCKDPLRLTMLNQLRSVFIRQWGDPKDRAVQDAMQTACETITWDNLELGASLVQKAATDEAVREIDNYLASAADDRRKARETGQPYIPRSLSGQVPNTLPAIQLPDALRPKQGGIAGQHKKVYDDFATIMPPDQFGAQTEMTLKQQHAIQALQQTLQQTLNDIERESAAHYKNNTSILSLTHSSFTQGTQSPEHERIKELVCSIHPLINEDTALVFARDIFQKVFDLSDRIIQEQKNAQQNQSNHHPTDLYVLMLANEVCLFVLQTAREKNAQLVTQELTRLFLNHEKRWQHKYIAVNFIRLRLINMAELDQHLTEHLKQPNNQETRQVVEFAGSIVQRCLVDEQLITQKDLKNTLEMLAEIAKATQAETAAAAAAAEAEVEKPKQAPIGPPAPVVKPAAALGQAGGSEAELRAMVSKMFKEWIAICTGKASKADGGAQTLQQQAMGYIHKLQHHGMLKAVPVMDKFFSLLMEMSLEYCVQDLEKQEKAATEGGDDPEKKKKKGLNTNSHFLTVDAFSDLIVLLIKCCGRGQQQPKPGEGKEGPVSNITAEVALLTKVVAVVSRVLMEDHDNHLQNLVNIPPNTTPTAAFHQQPYFRFFSNLLIALNQSQGDTPNPSSNDILTVFSNTFHALSPLRLPGFAFAWLELISHRMFMPKLLLTKNQEGWPHFQRLLVIALQFLAPSLRNAQLPDAIRLFYKGTLKILLVLLHDFPEFLCSCHFSFCDVIPPTCIQMRNVILSSFPGHMRLPDPFTPNLKVDLLPEITQAPRILSKYVDNLLPSEKGVPPVTKDEVDQYLAHRAPATWLQMLPNKLLLPPPLAAAIGARYNVPVVNSLVLYVGVQAIAQLQAASTESPQTTGSILDTPAMDIYQELAVRLDSEGRYLFLNALANHLRYPNNHTHYFSCVVLHLFAEARQHQEVIQEQITRILLERLIVNRPHPWGLLITFIELVKNPRYEFWKKSFIHCTPEIERLFDNVGQSCIGNLPKMRQGATAVPQAQGPLGAMQRPKDIPKL